MDICFILKVALILSQNIDIPVKYFIYGSDSFTDTKVLIQ